MDTRLDRTTVDAPPAGGAPSRCTERARRLAQVKFMALPLEVEPPAAEAEPAPGHWARRLLARIRFRFPGRLVAARP